MLDLENEEILPLSQAPTHPLLRQGRRRGRPVNRSTLERWRTRGVIAPDGSRVILETALLGAGIRVTTRQAIGRFFNRLNGRQDNELSPSRVRREHERAESELEAARI
jgi:hypothetical protein